MMTDRLREVSNPITLYDLKSQNHTLLECYFKDMSLKYCRFGNVCENLIFANIREFVAPRIQSSR